ncbi:MAG TPA: exodeoxyribonuclease VII large subunit [Burkholderiaceae bacterium]|nr:exodeoxyribonuclease VII large subunit [Burkholderiaceae bacterium]
MGLDFDSSDPATTRPAMTVSALNRAVSGLLERSFPLVRVRGEIGNLARAASGHWYFALKDDQAQVRCVMFRARNQLLDWTPRDGDEVAVDAIVSLYEARGEFQLGVEFMRRAGQGRLFEEFLKLKARLAGEGLFAAERKRALPRIPRRVAVVTSLQAAALTDVVTTLGRRAPYVAVNVYPVPVQGAGAGSHIAAMLERISQRAAQDAVDVVLLVRGGGAIEDLWAFNEEIVARAIVSCSIPVVVGIGHESDFTIADFAADLRAATPTAAAELVAIAAESLVAMIDAQQTALARGLRRLLEKAQQRIDYAARISAARHAPWRVQGGRIEELRLRSSGALVEALTHARAKMGSCVQRLLVARPNTSAVFVRLDALMAARCTAMGARLEREQMRIEAGRAALAHLDPGHILARGFSVVRDASGALVRDSERVGIGQALEIEFARGGASTRVERLR